MINNNNNNKMFLISNFQCWQLKKKHNTTHTRYWHFLFLPVCVTAYALQSYLACGTSMLDETTLRFCSSSDTERVLSFSMSSIRPARLCSGAHSSSTPLVFSLFCVPPFWPSTGTSRCPPLHKLCQEKTHTAHWLLENIILQLFFIQKQEPVPSEQWTQWIVGDFPPRNGTVNMIRVKERICTTTKLKCI